MYLHFTVCFQKYVFSRITLLNFHLYSLHLWEAYQSNQNQKKTTPQIRL